MKKILVFLLTMNISIVLCQSIDFNGDPELFEPGIISMEKSEVKITFSKDGKLILWGSTGRENGAGGLDIWKAEKTENGWGNPQSVSFNTPDNEFDPCFSSDGRIVYFFSNRPGGFGGEDLYSVQYDPVNYSFGTPVNMGPVFNTAGDEWGPTESIDGRKFIYCTDGFKGKGKHDIFISEKTYDGWGKPVNPDILNSETDDFDPVLLHDCKTIVFTREINENEAFLFISFLLKDSYSVPVQISSKMNIPGTWNFGSSIDPSDSSFIYYSTHINDNSIGRMDIYRIKYCINAINKW
jgi:hypothetical protein